MALKDLQQAILAKAQERARHISEREAEIFAKEEARIAAQARRIEEDIMNAAQTTADTQAAKIHQAARLEAKAEVLRAKQAELEQVKAEAVKSILGWKGDQLTMLLERCFRELNTNEGLIIPGEYHEDAVRKLAKKHHLKVSDKSISNEGGFIHRGEDSETNFTIHHLVEQIFHHHRAQIAKILFE